MTLENTRQWLLKTISTDPLSLSLSPKGGEGKHALSEVEWGEGIPVCSRRQELPAHYGDNHIYLMVRDSHWLYSYWEIQKNHQERCLVLLGGDWSQIKSILRVYDITERKAAPAYFDIVLEGLASHWYIHARPNRSFIVEIGFLHNDGRFIALARSNEQTTPRDGMSEIIDEQWMGIDFDKMYALSGGFEVGKSSLELKKLMEKRLIGAISSGSGGGRR
ncbi:MAG: DUF4912 domain-containing protein [Candidatus Omnitrophica bacterium]|nr:DUF4912 domain-containing protein [Candidatus Omnitrophota bacterium]